jgi:hypothetical protein
MALACPTLIINYYDYYMCFYSKRAFLKRQIPTLQNIAQVGI